jgi:hypothetical protein
MNYQIEKGVPLPRKASGRVKESKYPFQDMQPGDSFFVPGGTASYVSAVACAAARKGFGPFTIRNVEGGVRVWCLPKPAETCTDHRVALDLTRPAPGPATPPKPPTNRQVG